MTYCEISASPAPPGCDKGRSGARRTANVSAAPRGGLRHAAHCDNGHPVRCMDGNSLGTDPARESIGVAITITIIYVSARRFPLMIFHVDSKERDKGIKSFLIFCLTCFVRKGRISIN